MIPGFEDQLIGLEAGANKSFEVTFPEGYGNEKLAGNIAEFEVELTKVEGASLPEIDEEFIKAYGIENGTLASFNDDVKAKFDTYPDAVRAKLFALRQLIIDEAAKTEGVGELGRIIAKCLRRTRRNARRDLERQRDHDAMITPAALGYRLCAFARRSHGRITGANGLPSGHDP